MFLRAVIVVVVGGGGVCVCVSAHVGTLKKNMSHLNAWFPSLLLKKASGTDRVSVFTIHLPREQLQREKAFE